MTLGMQTQVNAPNPDPPFNPHFPTTSVAQNFKYLRRYDWSAAAAFECAKRMARVIGTFGDVNAVDHGGGYIFMGDYGPYLEYIEPCSCGCSGADAHPWEVYRVYLDDCPDADWDRVARCRGEDRSTDWPALWADGSPQVRAGILEAYAAYYGWRELDWEPLSLTAIEVWARYGEQPSELDYDTPAP